MVGHLERTELQKCVNTIPPHTGEISVSCGPRTNSTEARDDDILTGSIVYNESSRKPDLKWYQQMITIAKSLRFNLKAQTDSTWR